MHVTTQDVYTWKKIYMHAPAQGFQEMVYFANIERLATALGMGVCVWG